MLDVLCSKCGEKTEEREAGRHTAIEVIGFGTAKNGNGRAPVICHLAIADNGFASPPLHKSFKILLKCGIYIRMSIQCTK